MSTPTLQGRTSVLIVGAGPVGLAAAVALRERGIAVRIIEQYAAQDKHTYPVLLHPRTLRILETLGVVTPLEWRGRAITHLAVYADRQRRAILDLPSAGRVSPGAMTLPQDVLRQALMHRLAELGTRVEWQTRLVAIEQSPERVRSSLIHRERVEGAGPELRPEWLDVEAATLESSFVIGADGVRSTLREKLGIAWIAQGSRQMYAFYDAEDGRAGSEAHLVIHESQGNTVYPLQSDISRFTFQLSVGMPHAPGQAQLRQLLAQSMPWYVSDTQHFEWSSNAEFTPALASSFGVGRVWLAGDAAHSTGPLGGQSLNVGIHEANDLARRIAEHEERGDLAALGAGYAEQRRVDWQVLFGLPPSRPRAPKALDWVKRNLPTLVQALPAAGDDLDDLLEQLHVRAA